jgi:hypothetical protein
MAGHAVEQDGHGQGRHLLIRDDAAGVGVDDPVDLLVGQLALVALRANDVDGVEGFAHPAIMVDLAPPQRVASPKAQPPRPRRPRRPRRVRRWPIGE